MNKSKLLVYLACVWLVLEILAFTIVANAVGVLAAVLLGVGTTMLGLMDVRRLLEFLRARIGAKRERPAPDVLDGGLQALAALLLILPGFVSDFIGLALKAPSVRADISSRLRAKREAPGTIDLAPSEWKAVKEKKPRRRRQAAGKLPTPPTG